MNNIFKVLISFFFVVGAFFIASSMKNKDTNNSYLSLDKPKEIVDTFQKKLGLKNEQKIWTKIWNYKKEIIGVLLLCSFLFVFSPPVKSKIILNKKEKMKKDFFKSLKENERKAAKNNPLINIGKNNSSISGLQNETSAPDLSESEHVPPQVSVLQVEKRSPSLLESPNETSKLDLSENEHVPSETSKLDLSENEHVPSETSKLDLSESEHVPTQVPVLQVEKGSPSLLESPNETSKLDLSESEHVSPQIPMPKVEKRSPTPEVKKKS